MQLYTLDEDDRFGIALATALGRSPAAHEERRFDDGERKLRPLDDPRGHDVYVVAGLHGGPLDSPHDRLCRLLMFVATLRDHGAARVTAVLRYLAYARKDRRTQPFDPLGLRCVAQLFEAVGLSQLIVLEAHDLAALQNAFRCPTVHLSAHPVFDPVAATLVGEGPVVVASPDPGGVRRAQLWRESLQQRLGRPVEFAMVAKRRSAGRVSGTDRVAGDVAGATVLLLDDLIASGETLRLAAAALRHAGARAVYAFAAHGLFTPAAAALLADPALTRVVVTDSVPPWRLPAADPTTDRLQVVSAVPLFAAAISDCARAVAR